jgi:hypothetical protein
MVILLIFRTRVKEELFLASLLETIWNRSSFLIIQMGGQPFGGDRRRSPGN